MTKAFTLSNPNAKKQRNQEWKCNDRIPRPESELWWEDKLLDSCVGITLCGSSIFSDYNTKLGSRSFVMK